MRRALLLSLALLPLGGCISLLPKPPPPPRMYVLEAGDVQRLEGAPIEAVMAVDTPEGARAILGSDLIWRTGDTIAYVAQSQWSARADEALQSMVAQTMTRQGRFRAATPVGGARADYQVRWDVLSFEVQENGGAMTAHFTADVRIVDGARRVLAAQTISTEAPVSDRSSSIAAQALARAAREGSARIGVLAADAVTRAMAEAAAAEAAGAAAQTPPAPTRPSRRR